MFLNKPSHIMFLFTSPEGSTLEEILKFCERTTSPLQARNVNGANVVKFVLANNIKHKIFSKLACEGNVVHADFKSWFIEIEPERDALEIILRYGLSLVEEAA